MGGGKRCLPPDMMVVRGLQNNPNRLHPNLNCNVIQDSIKNTYNTIVLYTTLNGTYNVNAPIKKSHENSDTNIEDSVSYRAE